MRSLLNAIPGHAATLLTAGRAAVPLGAQPLFSAEDPAGLDALVHRAVAERHCTSAGPAAAG